MNARVLLLSGYDAVSHRALFEGLETRMQARGDHIGRLQLPARHFAWRVRSNALSWCFEEAATLNAGWDLVVATSMVDVSALRSICPSIRDLPFLTVFHENQFAYPLQPGARRDPNMQIRELYVALASDRLVFNTQYNRTTFLEGAREFLRSMPDHAPAQAIDIIEERSEVIHVPIALPASRSTTASQGPLRIVWNHRWEWDKAPERFFAALHLLKARGVSFRLDVVGQTFRKHPEVFDRAKDDFASELGQWGWVASRDDYLALLERADVVVSSALHEFQGLAMLEACAHGCVPLAPARLAYPEFFEAKYLYASQPDDGDAEARAIADRLECWATGALPGVPDISATSWDVLDEQWLDTIDAARDRHG